MKSWRAGEVTRAIKLAAIAVLWIAPRAEARKPAPLPDFALTTTDGTIVRSDQLRLLNRWLLMYVHPESGHSEVVLNILRDEPPAALGPKVIVIVSGVEGGDVARMAKSYPHLGMVKWYADPKRDAYRALKLGGSPTVLGMKQSTVQWALTGTLANPARLKAILK